MRYFQKYRFRKRRVPESGNRAFPVSLQRVSAKQDDGVAVTQCQDCREEVGVSAGWFGLLNTLCILLDCILRDFLLWRQEVDLHTVNSLGLDVCSKLPPWNSSLFYSPKYIRENLRPFPVIFLDEITIRRRKELLSFEGVVNELLEIGNCMPQYSGIGIPNDLYQVAPMIRMRMG